jgi:hypothetical protein
MPAVDSDYAYCWKGADHEIHGFAEIIRSLMALVETHRKTVLNTVASLYKPFVSS